MRAEPRAEGHAHERLAIDQLANAKRGVAGQVGQLHVRPDLLPLLVALGGEVGARRARRQQRLRGRLERDGLGRALGALLLTLLLLQPLLRGLELGEEGVVTATAATTVAAAQYRPGRAGGQRRATRCTAARLSLRCGPLLWSCLLYTSPSPRDS